jgi:hypothetical protein
VVGTRSIFVCAVSFENTRWPQTHSAPQHCSSLHQSTNGQVLGQPSSHSLIHSHHQSIARCGSVNGPKYAAAIPPSANAAAKAQWLVNSSAPSNIERHFNSPVAFAISPYIFASCSQSLLSILLCAHHLQWLCHPLSWQGSCSSRSPLHKQTMATNALAFERMALLQATSHTTASSTTETSLVRPRLLPPSFRTRSTQPTPSLPPISSSMMRGEMIGQSKIGITVTA